MEFILLICIFVIALYFIVSKKNYKTKNGIVKKDEIIKKYEDDLTTILQNCKSQNQKIEQKKLFLQKCNSELSRNIFFTEKEAIQIIKRLSKL